MTAFVRAVERVLSIVCRFRGHACDSYSGRCLTCGEQVFAP